jgi:hypothetical protein
MGTKNGQNKAPLSYILRPDDDPADEGNISTDDFEWMVYLMPHQGLACQYDNGMVYDELKPLLVNGTAFTWIHAHDRARNGRAAWKALVEHYKGPTKQSKVIEAAYHTIRILPIKARDATGISSLIIMRIRKRTMILNCMVK